MKRFFLLFISAVALLAFPKENFGQAPNLGTTSSFALFTAIGAFTNDGASVVTGDVGTHVGAFSAFPPGTLVGTKHVLDPASTTAATDVATAYSDLSGTTCGVVLGTTLGNSQVLSPGIYCLGAASTLNGDLILDGGGDPNALFIIKIDGALSASVSSNVILINSASLCNVYWQINGFFDLGENSVFRGTVISNGAINLLEGSSLLGRGLSTSGAISLHNNVVTSGGQASASVIKPSGATEFCTGGSVVLSGNNGGTWSNGETTPTITITASDDYFVTNVSDCGTATSNHITVTVNPLPTATTGDQVSFCAGGNVTIGAAAIAGHTYSWTPSTGLSSSTISNPVASPAATTTYALTETITATGCQATNSVIVTVDQLPVASTITAGAGGSSFCAGGSVVLSGNNGGVWSSGATTASITVNTSGDYFVTNSDACGSVTSNHIAVTVNPLPNADAGSDASICTGNSITLGVAEIVGHTYSWTPATGLSSATIATPVASPAATTTYTLTETITATGCQSLNSVTVAVDAVLPTASVILAEGPSTFCEGGNVILSGNTGGVWSNNATTPSITVTKSGDYYVTNSTGCGTVNSNHIAVTVNPIPATMAGVDRAICLNTSTVIGEVAVSGSTYSWSSLPASFTSSKANPEVTPLETTTYTVVETNAAGCTNNSSVIVTVNPLPAAVVGASRTICQNTSIKIGAASVPGSTYSWSSSPGVFSSDVSNPTVTPSITTTYTVVEVSDKDCTNSKSVVITVTPLPSAVAGANRTICSNSGTILGAASVSGNTYNWSSVPAGFTSTVANPTVNPLVTTTYSVIEISATGCSTSNSVVVSVNPAPEAVAGANTTICSGASTILGASAAAGSTYSWSSVPAGFSSTAADPTVSPMISTTYTVIETITATGCTKSNSVVINLNPTPEANAGSSSAICLGAGTTLGAEAVTGSSYSWSSVPAGFTSTVANPTVTPLVTTTYSLVETTLAGGCTNGNDVVVTVNPLPAAVAGADRAICLNSNTALGAALVSGSTYSWSSVPEGFSSTAADPTVSPLIPTTYTVIETITATGCTKSNSVVVNLNPAPEANAGSSSAICLGAGTTLGAEAVTGSSYSWSSVPAGFTSTIANPTVTPLVTTTYSLVETTLAGGCTNGNDVVVTVNPLPAAVAGADRAICLNSNTTIGATLVSGSTYSWSSIPAGFTSTAADPTVSPLLTTTYTVVETLASGCTKSNSVVVSLNPFPDAIAGGSRVICTGASTIIGTTAVTGSTYSWSSFPEGFTSTEANPSVTPIASTTYFLVETKSATGCSATNNVAVSVNQLPEAVAGADRKICLGAGTTLGAASVPGSTYSWSSNPEGFTSTLANPSVSPMETTTYVVEETSLSGNCSNSNSVVVTVNPLPAAIAGTDRVICVNSVTQIGAAAVIGSTYSWSSIPAGFTSTAANPTVAPLVNTTYSVVETNTVMGCDISNSVVVTVNPLPAAVAGAERTICLNTNTTLGAAAVSGSTYNWSSVPEGFTSTEANPTVTPLVTTTYTVEETSLSGICINKNNVVVTLIPAPAAIAGENQTICLNNNAQIGAAAVSGSTYSWSSVPAGFTSSISNPTVNPLVTTTYTVVVTNPASSCQSSNSVIVTINTVPNIITEPADQSACVGNAATFSVNATGASLTYQWRKGTLALTDGGEYSGATSASLTINRVSSADVASNYNVLINGLCSTFETSKNASLTVNAAPSIGFAVCAGNSASFSANAAGTGMTYQWRKGDVDLTDGGNISGATSATLTINPVSASDASSNYNVLINGACSPDATSLSTALSVNPALSIVSGPVSQMACVGSAASFSAVAAGAGLTYQWKKGEVNLTNGGNISGATSATLVINPVSATDVASNYNVVISGACSAAGKSADAALALCLETGIAPIKSGDLNNVVTIYPNPFTSSLDIKINDVSKISNYELRMYNILGEEVINTIITKDITNLNTSNLTSGVYLYEVKSNNKTIQSGKLISKQ